MTGLSDAAIKGLASLLFAEASLAGLAWEGVRAKTCEIGEVYDPAARHRRSIRLRGHEIIQARGVIP